jgi:hypothetical protein
MNRTDPGGRSVQTARPDARASWRARCRTIAFATTAFLAATTLCGGALLGLDMYLHARLQRYSGLNIWGYRGPSVGGKRAGELRIAVLGGSSAFGYGIQWDEAIPAALQRLVQEKRRERRRDQPRNQLHAANAAPVTVVNLAYNNEGAYAFKPTLEDYAYLDCDIVSLHSGYNDLTPDPEINRSVYRRDSPVFRATGYMPVLPVVLREKTASWLYGDIDTGYRQARGERVTVFRPGFARAAAAGALNAAAGIGASLDRQLGRLAAASAPPPNRQADRLSHGDTACPHPWTNYCRSLFDAIDYALAHGKRVLVVTEPYLPGAARSLHVYQQRVMAESLARIYGRNPRVRYVNTGASVDLTDRTLGYDTMHLTPAGAARVAAQLADPILELSRP